MNGDVELYVVCQGRQMLGWIFTETCMRSEQRKRGRSALRLLLTETYNSGSTTEGRVYNV